MDLAFVSSDYYGDQEGCEEDIIRTNIAKSMQQEHLK